MEQQLINSVLQYTEFKVMYSLTACHGSHFSMVCKFIDPNMSLNQIILIRKYFIKHFIAFYFCVAYIIFRYLQFLALACFYFQGLKAIYTCFLRITDLFVCLFFHLSLSVFFETNLSLDKIQNI